MAALGRGATGRMGSFTGTHSLFDLDPPSRVFRSGSAPRAAGPERLVGRTTTRVCGDTAAKREGWPLKYSCRRRDGRKLRYGNPGDALATTAQSGVRLGTASSGGALRHGADVGSSGIGLRGPVHGRRTAGHPQPDQQAHADDPGGRGDLGARDHAGAAARGHCQGEGCREVQGPTQSASTRRRSGNCAPSSVPPRSRRSSVSRAAASIARWAQHSFIGNQSGKALASSSSTFCSEADTLLPMPRNPPAASATPRARSSTRPLKKRLSSALIVSIRART